MKRLFGRLMGIGLLLGCVCGMSYAGGDQDRDIANGNYYDSQVNGSTNTASAAFSYTLLAPSTRGGVSDPGRYCFDNLQAQLPTGTTFYLIDNSTTPSSGNGNVDWSWFGAGTTVPLKIDVPARSPICLGYGDTANMVQTGTGAALVSWSGYIAYGGAGGSVLNHGK